MTKDDERDAKKKPDDEHLRIVGIKIAGLNWMKENKFITEEEFESSMKYMNEKKKHKPSGDSVPGSSNGSGLDTQVAKQPPKPKQNKTDYKWIKANLLPNVTGCTITHVCNTEETRWYGNYPDQGSKSRHYDPTAKKPGRSELECLNKVLHWIWEEDTKATGELPKYEFSPRCD